MVLIGAVPDDAEPQGDYCVPHAALAGGDHRDEQEHPVWIDVAAAPTHAWAVALTPRSVCRITAR